MKKYISVTISLLLIISCFGQAAFCGNSEMASGVTDTDTTLYEEATELFSSIGIKYFVEDGWNSSALRKDFICALAQIMNFYNISPVQHRFSDIEKGSDLDAIVGHAVRLGLISDAELFRPYDTITYNEAYKLCVVAAGYAMEAQLQGGYPQGYNSVAHKLKLDSNLRTDASALTVGEAVLLLKNLGDTPVRLQSIFGDVNEYHANESITVFSHYLNLYELEGIVMADELTSVYNQEDNTRAEYVRIDDAEYKCVFPVTVGSKVKGYYYKKGAINEIVYISDSETEKLVIDFSDIISFQDTQIEYADSEGKSKKVKLSKSPVVIYNGKAYSGYLGDEMKISGRKYELLETNGDSVYDTIHIKEAYHMLVSRVDVYYGYIFDSNGGMLNLSDSDTFYRIVYDGERIKLSDIDSGAILSVYESLDKKAYEIYVGYKTISALVSEKDENRLYAGGVPYEYNEYFEKHYMSGFRLGTSYEIALDYDGRFSAIVSGEEKKMFGYVMGFDPADGLEKSKIKIFNQSGEFLIVEIPDFALVNGYKKNEAEITAMLFENGVFVEQLIRYTLNSRGELNKLDVIKDSTGIVETGEDGLKRYIPAEVNLMYRANKIFGGKFAFDADTVFISVSPDTSLPDEKRYSTVNPFFSSSTYNMADVEFYNVNDKMSVGAVVYKKYGGSNVDTEALNGVVEYIRPAISPDGEDALKISVYSANKFGEYYITDSALIETLYSENSTSQDRLDSGDYIRFNVTGDGIINGVIKDYDYSTNTVINFGSNIQGPVCYCVGKVYDIASDYLVMIPAGEEPTELNRTLVSIGTSNIAVYDDSLERINQGGTGDIITYRENPDLCTTVLVRLTDNYYTGMVVFTENK